MTLRTKYHPETGQRLFETGKVKETFGPRIGTAPTLTIGTKWDAAFSYTIGNWVGADDGTVQAKLGYYSTPADPSTFTSVLDLPSGGTTVPSSLDGETPVLRVTALKNQRNLTHDTVAAAAISGRDDSFPATIAADEWDAQYDTRSASAPGGEQTTVGHRIFWGVDTLDPSPTGYTLRVYSGVNASPTPSDAITREATSAFYVSAASFPIDQEVTAGMTTNGTMDLGQPCTNILYWRRTSDGAYQQASADVKTFNITALDSTPDPEPEPDPDPGDQTGNSEQDIVFDGFTYGLSATTTVYTSALGEPIVIGPVTLVSTSPAWDGTLNGSMLDWSLGAFSPGGSNGVVWGHNRQGFENHPSSTGSTLIYESSLNYDPGANGGSITISEGSFIKSESKTNPSNPPRPGTQRLGVLTVLPSGAPTPAVGSFRPAQTAASKTIQWTTADCAAVSTYFPNLAVTSGALDKSLTLARLKRPVPIGFLHGNQGRRIYGGDHYQNDYFGDSLGGASMYADAALMMCTDALSSAEKVEFRNAFVQQGIDIYERWTYQSDVGTLDGGALGPMFKLPLVMAALFLDDTNMKNKAADIDQWYEDRQVKYLDAGDTNLDMFYSLPYQTGDIGTPEWGSHMFRSPRQCGRELSGHKNIGTYRKANGYLVGIAALGHIVPEIKTIWSNNAIWDYIDLRENWFLNLINVETRNRPTDFATSMYSTYRASQGATRTWGPGNTSNTW